MFAECSQCPGSEHLRNELEGLHEDDNDIHYVQGINTDRCELVSIVQAFDEAIEILLQTLEALKKHFESSGSVSEVEERQFCT